MLRGMTAGVSGLKAYQAMMDVVGNNIANAGTAGYKASRLTFREAFSARLQSQSSPGSGFAWTNPVQIGTGTEVGDIDPLFTQGGIEETEQPFDLAIMGDGFFPVSSGSGLVYSRVGSFQLDSAGRLVLAGTDLALQGINGPAADGPLSLTGLETLAIPLDGRSPARATAVLQLSGNLDAGTTTGGTHTIGASVYDDQGDNHSLEITMTNTGTGTWSWSARCDGQPVQSGSTGTVTFDAEGKCSSFTYPDGAPALSVATSDGQTMQIRISAEGAEGSGGITGLAQSSDVAVASQDGRAAGKLVSTAIDTTGMITGLYSNGARETLGRIPLVSFRDPAGLQSTGAGTYMESPASGSATVIDLDAASSSAIVAGAIEDSNVDLAAEFTKMIVAQRGFQANARLVTTADEMLTQIAQVGQ